MIVRSSRRLVDTYVLCVVRVWYLIGLTLLTLSAHGLTFYLSVIIHGIILFVLNSMRIYYIRNRLKVFMK